jgi:hypothetical protein
MPRKACLSRTNSESTTKAATVMRAEPRQHSYESDIFPLQFAQKLSLQ